MHIKTLEDIIEKPAAEAAPLLLGTVLSSSIGGQMVSGIVSEVEAYDQTDPASHTYRGETLRNRSMFQKAGTIYVYFTYGMHYCMNISTYQRGVGSGVLLRAVQPLTGIEIMWQRRYKEPIPIAPGNMKMRQLTDGPAKLTQAFGVGRQHDGMYLFDPSTPLRLELPEVREVTRVVQTPRIGISVAKDTPWRWHLETKHRQ